ncbi:uncharacterized protein LOC131076382 isoform X1 [Cryptomeria japonica]|uniref:uncharacterized protein LOC131076382 isoform X1 n=1 Tax=Cryptomeria japonica TaxID=3369 RepID=UPI0027DA21AA|nr:uncharacterized protein LOC131076382 isoform X1 [Cryptomeria japonica]
MTSEIQAAPCMMKVVEMSYCTEPGWRLATSQEAKHNLEMIKKEGLLKGRQKARLLDGWISQGRGGLRIGDDFRRNLGHMLVIQIQPSLNYSSGNSDSARSIYSDFALTLKRREVALLLCAYDWNYEVVYWLLNCWERGDTFNPVYVREGNTSFSNKTTFVEMNKMICSLGRILGEEGLASQKVDTRALSKDSVKEVMVSMGKSCWDKFSGKNKKILGQTFLEMVDGFTSDTIGRCSEVNWFENFASQEDTSNIWNFLWYYISSNVVASIVHKCFSLLVKDLGTEMFQARRQKEFIMSTAILHYVLEYEKDEGEGILARACKDTAGDGRQRFKDTLKNRSFYHYDASGDYPVLNKILIYAAKNEDSLLVNKVLDWGAQPQANLGPEQQNMALRYAIEQCRSSEILRNLFDKCPSKEEFANAKNEEGKSALHLACYYGDLDMCQMVLRYGGRPEVQDKRGRLPLHYMVVGSAKGSNERENVLRSLFDKCRSNEQVFDAADDEGMTALHWACRDADISVCNMVLEYGGKLDVRGDKGCLPLHYAVNGTGADRIEIIRSLFQECLSKEELVNLSNKEGMTALHCACRAADVSVCETVLQYGGKTDVLDGQERFPLYYAVERGNEGIVDLLIGVGDSDAVQKEPVSNLDLAKMVTCKGKDGVSPLDMAIKKYNIKLMVKLLSASQQPLETYIDKVDSARLLRESASEGNLEVVEKLLEKGADPLACDNQGQTALHHASMCENDYNAFKVTELMLAKCTSEEERKKWAYKLDDKDQTALSLAAMKGHERLCDYFCEINKDADGPGLVYEVVKRGHQDNPNIIFSLLCMGSRESIIDWGRRESVIDNSRQTLLHVAASTGRLYITDTLLQWSENPKVYVRTPDILGQTALHKAAKEGHADTVIVLLHWGAQPLLERDSDGRTALHCLAQNKSEDQAIAVAELLLKKCGSDEKKLLFLWASAAGLGTADEHLGDSPLKNFLLQQKEHFTKKIGKENNLLRTAACLGDVEMTKELLTRDARIGDIQDQNWLQGLKNEKERDNVETVCKQIQSIVEQGNDQPAISDYLGRRDFAYGLAALFLNPYLKPPITVGISGSWGMGKSSLMLQTEGILLKTAAQLALLLPSEMTSSVMTSSSFPGIQNLERSAKGQKKYQQIKKTVDLLNNDENEKDSVRECLNQYDAKYHNIYKSLAAMESSYMFESKDEQSKSEIDSPIEGSVPAILTVQYNAWKYRNESEALAGIAVEITKEMEGIMTDAQWLSTCLRNTWLKQKQVIWIEIIFPCLLAALLAISFTWILWLVLDKYKFKDSIEIKYSSLPLTIIIMVWTLVKKVMSTVNPVSVQLMNYIKLPDHAEKLGYQERVISDINFLREEISKKPYSLCSVASYIWHCMTQSCIISLLSCQNRGDILVSSIPSANLRIVVFVDDLDRCQESVILQVLSAINLVLAVCKINVILGMDKTILQRAIMKKYGDKSSKHNKKLANMYLQKIIQLPLDLPDPSEVQSKKFLDQHLGVFQKQKSASQTQSETDEEDDSVAEIEIAYNALFSLERFWGYKPDFTKILGLVTPTSGDGTSVETGENLPGTQTGVSKEVAITVQNAGETSDGNSKQMGPIQTLWQTVMKVAASMKCINLSKTGHIQTNHGTKATQEANIDKGDKSSSDFIPIR